MDRSLQYEQTVACSGLPPSVSGAVVEYHSEVEDELARYLPHLSRMSEQLKQSSVQIETSVVGVCDSFQGIAERAKQAVDSTAGFLSRERNGDADSRSFESL